MKIYNMCADLYYIGEKEDYNENFQDRLISMYAVGTYEDGELLVMAIRTSRYLHIDVIADELVHLRFNQLRYCYTVKAYWRFVDE